MPLGVKGYQGKAHHDRIADVLGAVENDEKSRRVLGPEPFTKHAPEFEIIRTLLLHSLFPTTLGNSVGAIRRDI